MKNSKARSDSGDGDGDLWARGVESNRGGEGRKEMGGKGEEGQQWQGKERDSRQARGPGRGLVGEGVQRSSAGGGKGRKKGRKWARREPGEGGRRTRVAR